MSVRLRVNKAIVGVSRSEYNVYKEVNINLLIVDRGSNLVQMYDTYTRIDCVVAYDIIKYIIFICNAGCIAYQFLFRKM